MTNGIGDIEDLKSTPSSSVASTGGDPIKKLFAVGLGTFVVTAVVSLSIALGITAGGAPYQEAQTEEDGTTITSPVWTGCNAPCDDTTGICTYTARVDMHASEFGLYSFVECSDVGNMPDIGMELGRTYRFLQSDITNYYHPLGFAYGSDGALSGAEELDEVSFLSYQLAGEVITLEGGYESQFGHPIEEWATNGEYFVDVTLPFDFEYDRDLFYFCHIHRYLGGRIKLLRDGRLVHPEDLPLAAMSPPNPSSYDKECGTFGLVAVDDDRETPWLHSMSGDYRTPHTECPITFVCEEGKSKFATCVDAINCHMFNGMTTNERHGEKALFLHQMIPHHQNAVNMAKALMSTWDYECDEMVGSSEDQAADPATLIECTMINLLRSIIHGQNAQIQTMRDLLESNGWPEFDNCDRPMKGSVVSVNSVSEYVDMDVSRYGFDKDNVAENSTIARNGDSRGLQAQEQEEGSTNSTFFATTPDNTTAQIAETIDVANETEICRASCSNDTGIEVCTFTAKLDIFASDLGAFYFDECGIDNPFPTIGIEVGQVYIFVQEDITNWYHPLGFAYHPDGAHAGLPEVEEGDYLTYMLDGETVELEVAYEPLFFHPPDQWAGYGKFSVGVKFDKDYDQDLFYFCHIHHGMSGRIKLLQNDVPIQGPNFPNITYRHPEPSEYDKSCGTYGLSPFQLPHPECPESFVCDKTSEFAGCIESINCYMMAGMTTRTANAEVLGDVELFLHQMIPHHINAVNMAKALLKTDTVDCPSLVPSTGAETSADASDDCSLDAILRDIIGNQNYQIQIMYGVLKDGGFPETNDCVVDIGAE